MELDCYVSFLFYCCALASSKRYIGLCGTLLKLSVPIQVVEEVLLYIFLGPGTQNLFYLGQSSKCGWVGGKKHCYIFLVLVGPWVGQWVAQLNIPCHCLRVCLPAWLPASALVTSSLKSHHAQPIFAGFGMQKGAPMLLQSADC